MRARSRRHVCARIFAAALVGVVACAAAATATAGSDAYTVRLNAADERAARAVMLTQSDVGDPFLWESGEETPDVSSAVRCPDFRPKVSDIVVTGAAAMRFRQPGLVMHSVSKVFRTAGMVERQWRRAADSTRYVGCVRQVAKRSLTPEERFVGFRQLHVPRIGAHSEGFRTLVDVETADGTVRLAIDTVVASRGRTQVALTTMIRLTSVPARWPRELALVRALVGRARA